MNTAELITQILWGIIALPLICYPMILLANVMSFAAPKVQKISFKGILFKVFLIISTLYPFIYYFCFQASLASVREENYYAAVFYAIPPLAIGGILYGIIKK